MTGWNNISNVPLLDLPLREVWLTKLKICWPTAAGKKKSRGRDQGTTDIRKKKMNDGGGKCLKWKWRKEINRKGAINCERWTKNWVLGGNLDTWKTNSPITEPHLHPSSLSYHLSLKFHLQCDFVAKQNCAYVKFGSDLIPTSNSSDVLGSALVMGHTDTHTRTRRWFPFHGRFQQLSAWQGNQALDHRLK